MILSSADILRILSGDAIIREEADLKIVEGRPGFGVGDRVYIYIDKYPTIDEFEATWNIWVQDNSGMGSYVLNAMTVLLPGFDFNGKHYTTTDFASERTVIKTQEEIDREEFKDRFSGLEKDLQGRLSTVRDGRDGIDGKDGVDGLPGKDGRDGRDGKDGKDLDATQVELEDLANVEQGIPKEKGQVLTWDGTEWTNLFVPQIASVSGGGGASALNDLTDVDAPTPSNGDVISYNSTSGLWETTAAPPADISGNSIDDLSDVTIDPALLEKDFGLVYDGAEWVVASPPVLVEGHNQTGATIPKATPVYVAGTHNSGKPLLGLADANGSGNAPAIGLAHEDITDGIDGHVMLSGVLKNVDTSAYLAGEALYLSTTPGVLTNVRPTAANEKVQKVGLVTRSHASAGSILIIGAGRTNDINNELVALIGAGDRNAVDLGTFTGGTISDNVDVKVALQELETAVESTVGSIADLTDTDVTGVQDGEILVYRSATGDWTAEPAPATGLQPGDNVSELTNDANYITLADVPDAPVYSVNGQTGVVTLTADDVGALESGDNISELSNDAGYITDAGVTQIVAGTNITIDPIDGTGAVTINAPPSGVPEAPLDGNYYVRASGAWVKLTDALSSLGVIFTDPVDAGNFTTGLGTAITNALYDGGNFTDGTSTATDNDIIDGGLTTS